MDNECKKHITSNKLFSDLDNSLKYEIKHGDDHLVNALKKGIVIILNKENGTKYILHVYHVQGLKHKLLSIVQMSQNGYKVIFESHICIILDKPSSKVVITRFQMT